MPDPFDVHAQSKWDWGGPQRGSANRGAISDQVADPAPAKAPPGRKDPEHCKQSPDKMHHEALACRPWHRLATECHWAPLWSRGPRNYVLGWRCYHEAHCEYCGKIFIRRIADEQCPAYPGTEEQKAEAADKVAECNQPRQVTPWQQARSAAKSRRTGYRRPKAGKKGA
jgi:hypothetical protein